MPSAAFVPVCHANWSGVVLIALAAGAIGMASPATVSAQEYGVPAAAARDPRPAVAVQQRPESASVLKRVRSVQASFERLRQYRLPRSWDYGGGSCDDIVGRMCYRDDDVDGDFTPPPEAREVVREREKLLGRLADAAEAIPGDDWVAGQRVRYLIEAGRVEDARGVAGECQGTRWWCLALVGYADHEAGNFVAAESAFANALRDMPARERDRWTDLRPLLSDADYGAYKKLDPPSRELAAARFWWLADPLWSMPGNDRRTEHFARLVFDRLQHRARTTEGRSWGDDLRELLLRYGRPYGWQRLQPRPGAQIGEPAGVVTYFRHHGRDFLPPLSGLDRQGPPGVTAWPLSPRFAQTRYAPVYAVVADSLPHQLAVFRRGDSAVIVAAYEMPEDSAAGDERQEDGPLPHDAAAAGIAGRSGWDSTIEAALVVAADTAPEPAIARLTTIGRTGALRLAVEPARGIVSIEALSRGAKRAARARYGLALGRDTAVGLSVSDLLLVESAEPLPSVLDEAVPRMRPTTSVRAGERLALYWETYRPVVAGPMLDVSLTLLAPKSGWLRRRAEDLRLAATPTDVEMRFQVAPPPERPIQHHSLAITLPDLPPGRYALRVTVAQEGNGSATAERAVVVEK
ncbi:MAG: hypothetical protein M3373_00195 [Gemmatimonadota bacterium]|nr:hypothetical protein [Gemmatimonadota bacterium]